MEAKASSPPPPALSVVIPAYNEEHRLGATLTAVLAFLRQRGESHQVLVVDDGSTDRTAESAARFRAQGVELLRLPENRGKGAAVREGVLASRGEWILVSDADLSTPIEELDRLVAHGDEADIVLGSRALPESRIEVRQRRHRELLGQGFNLLVRLLGISRFRDTQCGFKLMRGDRARALFRELRIDGFAFDVEMVAMAQRRNLRLREVGVRWRNSRRSKVRLERDVVTMFVDLLRIRWRTR